MANGRAAFACSEGALTNNSSRFTFPHSMQERGFEMESLVTLLAKMKHEIPDERPTAEQALAQFLGVQGA